MPGVAERTVGYDALYARRGISRGHQDVVEQVVHDAWIARRGNQGPVKTRTWQIRGMAMTP